MRTALVDRPGLSRRLHKGAGMLSQNTTPIDRQRLASTPAEPKPGHAMANSESGGTR